MSMVYSHTPGGVVIFVIILCGWGGVGWGNNVHVYLDTSDRLHYGLFPCPWTYPHTHTTCCYVVISSLALAQWRDAPLWYFALQAACTILHTHKLDATLWYLLLRVHNLAHTLNATLWYVLLCLHNLAHTHTDLMLRYDLFSLVLEQSCTDTWCYVMTSPLALAQSCTHTHTRCCVVISFLGQNLPMDFSATIWQGDNWPTTWKKNGTRAEETFVVRWSKHIIHEVAKREFFFVHWSQERRGARSRVAIVTML